jgi:hypothetical protein
MTSERSIPHTSPEGRRSASIAIPTPGPNPTSSARSPPESPSRSIASRVSVAFVRAIKRPTHAPNRPDGSANCRLSARGARIPTKSIDSHRPHLVADAPARTRRCRLSRLDAASPPRVSAPARLSHSPGEASVSGCVVRVAQRTRSSSSLLSRRGTFSNTRPSRGWLPTPASRPEQQPERHPSRRSLSDARAELSFVAVSPRRRLAGNPAARDDSRQARRAQAALLQARRVAVRRSRPQAAGNEVALPDRRVSARIPVGQGLWKLPLLLRLRRPRTSEAIAPSSRLRLASRLVRPSKRARPWAMAVTGGRGLR